MQHYLKHWSILLVFVCFFLCSTNSGLAAQSITYIINGIPTSYPDFQASDDVKTVELVNDQERRYTDLANGFSLRVPQHMAIDSSISKIRTIIFDEQTQIEIFYDDLHNTISDAVDYISYGNRFTQNTRDHTVELDEMLTQDQTQVHLLKWTRRKLSRIPNDKNYYASAEFIKNNAEIYTVIIKSSAPIVDEMSIINSFRITEQQGIPNNFKPFRTSRTHLNAETQNFYNMYFNAAAPLRFGVFEPSAPESFHYLTPLEDKLDYTFPFLLRYQSLEEKFPRRGLQKAYENHKYVELTLQTVNSGLVSSEPLSPFEHANASIMYDILDGYYDDYLNAYAQEVKAFGHPVLFRLNNEMNGDWCWYSAFYTCKDGEIYRSLWRYIYETFEHNGVDNVLWVWNPHDVSRPDFKWNHHLMYYPGDEYVDLIGLTGYNTGTYFPGESWREFLPIYQPMYNEYMQLFPKPFIITEFGSNSVGGNKAVWINNMFDNLKGFPNIKVALWWSGIDYDQNSQPGRIYLIDEDDRITEVFRNRLKDFGSQP